MPRRRLISALCLGGTALAIAGATMGSGVASGSESPPTTALTQQPSSRPPASASASSPANPASSNAVLWALPAGSQVAGSRAVQSGKANYVAVTAKDGSTDYTVMFYNVFDPQELTNAGLPSTALGSGTAWIGSDTNQFRSVYFLSSAGRGVYIASGGSGELAPQLRQLESEATKLASSNGFSTSGGT